MALLPIYTYGTSILRKKAKPITAITDEIITLIRNMFETMHYSSGIGLAANQVGSSHKILVVDISEMEGYEEVKPLVVINPRIVKHAGELEMEEGCLSIPGIRSNVKRAESITIHFADANFNEVTLEADELLARVILHEVDHLNGILFTDHIPKDEYKKILPELKEIEKGIVDSDYEVVTAVDEKKPKKKRK